MRQETGNIFIGFLLAMSLSLLLLAGMYDSIVVLQRQCLQQQQKLQQTEMLNLALKELNNAIVSVNLSSCGNILSLRGSENDVTGPASKVLLSLPIAVFSAEDAIADAWHLHTQGSGQISQDSPILVIQSSLPEHFYSQNTIASNSTEILLNSSRGIHPGDNVILCDCHHLLIDSVLSVHAHSVILKMPTSYQMPVGTEVRIYQLSAYYIGQTLRLNPEGNRITALYRMNTFGKREELFPEISHMKIVAGMTEKVGGEVTDHILAAQVPNWDRVTNLNIILQSANVRVRPVSQLFLLKSKNV